jgi:ribosome-binding factor A
MNFPAKPYKRKVRVNELIREELGKLIQRNIEVPGAILTITDVDVTDKLDYARIKISVLPKDKERQALGILQDSTAHLQHDLLRIINIKPMPHLQFQIDEGSEYAAKMEKVFLEAEKSGELEKSE